MRGYVEAFAVGLFVFSHSIADNIVIERPTRESKDSSSRSLFLLPLRHRPRVSTIVAFGKEANTNIRDLPYWIDLQKVHQPS